MGGVGTVQRLPGGDLQQSGTPALWRPGCCKTEEDGEFSTNSRGLGGATWSCPLPALTLLRAEDGRRNAVVLCRGFSISQPAPEVQSSIQAPPRRAAAAAATSARPTAPPGRCCRRLAVLALLPPPLPRHGQMAGHELSSIMTDRRWQRSCHWWTALGLAAECGWRTERRMGSASGTRVAIRANPGWRLPICGP